MVRASHLDELVGLGTLTTHAARFLEVCVEVGLNIIAGGTQAGNPQAVYAPNVLRRSNVDRVRRCRVPLVPTRPDWGASTLLPSAMPARVGVPKERLP